MNRRDFVSLTAAGVAAAPFAPLAFAAPPTPAALALKKAVWLNMVDEDLPLLDKFRLVKDLGFDGVEIERPSDVDAGELLRARDATGVAIHSVVDSVHWDKTLSDPDPSVRAEGLEGLKAALRDAKLFGAPSVLLVPAVVTAEVSYDEAYRRSQAEIRKAVPLAEELGVKIAIENVWNHFLLSPLEFARYVDEFESPWVAAYFDIGNVVTYGWPEHWIPILGDRIVKLHAKAFSRKKRDEEGLRQGFRVEIGEGDIDWSAVRQALAGIGYSGWVTAEVPGGDRNRLRDISERLDRYVLGKDVEG